MTLWVAIGVLAVINFAIKAAGPALLGDRPLPPRVSLVVQSLAPALLAGLLIVALLGQGWREFDWRLLPGLTVIGVLWLLGRSQIVCIVAGVLVTVAVRALV
ncbi:MAG: AzlD domain-containing protein [Geodermatophilaceae bacterium]|nr:AzlD domain-containing protein [Geodermatophilaceae bacterium]